MYLSRATTADIPVIARLAEVIWWEHYPEIISDEQIRYMLSEWYSPAALSEQMTRLGHDFWLIAESPDSAPCGYVAISCKEPPDGYYLHKFYINGRRKGMGSAAFAELLSHYPDWQTVRLNVNRRNFRSVNFYFKMGFTVESIMDLPVGEEFIMDDFVMVKRRHHAS